MPENLDFILDLVSIASTAGRCTIVASSPGSSHAGFQCCVTNKVPLKTGRSLEKRLAIYSDKRFHLMSSSFDKMTLSHFVDSTDYLEITSANNPLVPFSSNAATHRQCFNVNITDDSILEDSEYFSLNLTLAGGSTEEVKIVQDASVVEITDDDCKLITVYNSVGIMKSVQ